MELCRALPEAIEVTAQPDAEGVFVVRLGGETPDLSAVSSTLVGAGIRLIGLREIEVGLEEVFMKVTRGETQ